MKYICIYASDLATIVGINKYQNISDVIIKMWQRISPKDYDETLKDIQRNNKKYVPTETEIENVKRISKENNLNIDKCMSIKNTEELKKKRNEIIKTIDEKKDITEETKKEFKKNLESMTNKNFGTMNEKNVIDYYSQLSNKKISTPSRFIKKMLCTYKDIYWNIGGKIDGITDDNIVIEIKNRIYKLFNTMRDYEKPQIQAYMFIMNINRGHLVECLKENEGMKINIIEENFDEEYWKSYIIPKINNFIKLFHLFLDDINLKTYILVESVEKKEKILSHFLNI